MSIFSVAAGKRINITTKVIDLVLPDLQAKGMLRASVTYDATATDEYQTWHDGTKRRKFIDASVDFGFGREIWLTDGPSILKASNIDWPDVIGGE